MYIPKTNQDSKTNWKMCEICKDIFPPALLLEYDWCLTCKERDNAKIAKNAANHLKQLGKKKYKTTKIKEGKYTYRGYLIHKSKVITNGWYVMCYGASGIQDTIQYSDNSLTACKKAVDSILKEELYPEYDESEDENEDEN